MKNYEQNNVFKNSVSLHNNKTHLHYAFQNYFQKHDCNWNYDQQKQWSEILASRTKCNK